MVKTRVVGIADKIRDAFPDLKLRVAFVGYRSVIIALRQCCLPEFVLINAAKQALDLQSMSATSDFAAECFTDSGLSLHSANLLKMVQANFSYFSCRISASMHACMHA